MLAADVAKVSFSEIQDYFAKPSLVKMRTSVIGAKLEMRLAVTADAPLYDIAIASL